MSWLLSSSMATDQIEHVTFVYTGTYVANLYSSFEIISYFQQFKSKIDRRTCFQFGHNFFFCATTEWISKKLGIN